LGNLNTNHFDENEFVFYVFQLDYLYSFLVFPERRGKGFGQNNKMKWIFEKDNYHVPKISDNLCIPFLNICSRTELDVRFSVKQAPPFALQKFSAFKT